MHKNSVMEYLVTFGGTEPGFTPIARLARFAVERGTSRWTVEVQMSDRLGMILAVEDAEEIAILNRAGLTRTVGLIESEALPADPGVVKVQLGEEDAPTLRLPDRKVCSYQHTESGDLYCSAATKDDPEKVASLGARLLARTSLPECDGCSLPDSNVVCSSHSHPMVQSFGSDRVLLAARCDAGRSEVDSNSGACRLGGHACWHRVVTVETAVPQHHPLSLLESLDFLDAMWRLRFRHPLIRRTALVTAASLAADVVTRDDLKARLSDLAEVLDFQVPDTLLNPVPEGSEPTKGAVKRLYEALERVGVTPPPAAVDALRSALRVRSALQHPGMTVELQTHLERLGVRPTGQSNGEIWAVLRSRVTAAVIELRDAVKPTD